MKTRIFFRIIPFLLLPLPFLFQGCSKDDQLRHKFHGIWLITHLDTYTYNDTTDTWVEGTAYDDAGYFSLYDQQQVDKNDAYLTLDSAVTCGFAGSGTSAYYWYIDDKSRLTFWLEGLGFRPYYIFTVRRISSSRYEWTFAASATMDVFTVERM